MRTRETVTKLIWTICATFGCLGVAQAQIHVTEAQIGCLDLKENRGNLTAVVGSACNGKMTCSYKAPTPDQYNKMKIPVHGRTFCTQGMEIEFQCGTGPTQTVNVQGDAWNHDPAELVCQAAQPPPVQLPPQGGRLKGFVDLHTHPLSNLGFGGKMVYGGVDVGALLPADPDCNHNVRATSVQQALGHDKSTHGGHNFFSNTCGDEIRKAIIGYGVQPGYNNPGEDAHGFPDFNDWPKWDDITHQKMWVDWIRRAYIGGLRVMVALAVNNKTLADAVSGPGDGPDDDKASADLQIAETKAFVGRHNDFMEVAYTSADLQRIVSSNKLAVVLGIEIDNIGNLQKAFPLTPAEISAEIDRLYGEGVRYIFPIHLLDNAFGGTAAYTDLFNYSTFREDGHYWDLGCAPNADISSETINYKFNILIGAGITGVPVGPVIFAFTGMPLGASSSVLNLSLPKLGTVFPPIPLYPPICGQVNQRGLTDHGQLAIREMMRHGMLIDIDHMSDRSQAAAIAIAQEQSVGAGANAIKGYPLNSGHNDLRGYPQGGDVNERSMTAAKYAIISNLHGMAGVGSAGAEAYAWADMYQHVIAAMNKGTSGAVGAFGTDTDGMERNMPPPSLEQDAKVENPEYLDCIGECLPGDMTPSALASCRARQAQLIPGCRKKYPPGPIVQCVANCGHQPIQYSNSFPMSTLGTKSWDYNSMGVAHYGMLADFLQDVRTAPGGANLINNNLMYGADYFFQTWKKCEALKTNIK